MSRAWRRIANRTRKDRGWWFLTRQVSSITEHDSDSEGLDLATSSDSSRRCNPQGGGVAKAAGAAHIDGPITLSPSRLEKVNIDQLVGLPMQYLLFVSNFIISLVLFSHSDLSLADVLFTSASCPRS